ncbi:MAG: S41 family peptidase, partial [Verrucomicrobiota bacterium]
HRVFQNQGIICSKSGVRNSFKALLFLITCSGPVMVAQEQPRIDERYRSSLLFARVMEMVRDDYVDQSEINYDRLTFSALDGMLSSLDPYCEFLDSDQYAEVKSDAQGVFGGIGVYVGLQKDRNLIVNMPVPGGPAFNAGLLPGDQILEIEGVDTKGMSLTEAVRVMRGRPGSSVALTVFRPQTRKRMNLTIARQVINVPTVRDAQVLSVYNDGRVKVGYLRILQFGEHTLEELEDAMAELRRQGANGLIIDLRNNPGGILESAVQVAGRFVKKNRVIAYTEGRKDGEGRNYYRAEGRIHDLKTPLVLLVNRHSASGAEIVAGALKDLGRAVLVGETTYGKGSVQTIQPIDRGIGRPVGIRLTTAKYYTPSRQVIHEMGVSPQIEVPVTQDEEALILKKQNRYVLTPDEQARLAQVEDRQLDRAVTILQGLMIYNANQLKLAAR